MDEIVFLTKEDLLEIHADQLARYGGLEGVLDEGGVESIVEAPKFWLRYEDHDPEDTLPGVAAKYLHSLATTQYFNDGNKRTGAASADVFLQLNGYQLTCRDAELYRMTKLAAKGHLSHRGLIEWIRDCVAPRD